MVAMYGPDRQHGDVWELQRCSLALRVFVVWYYELAVAFAFLSGVESDLLGLRNEEEDDDESEQVKTGIEAKCPSWPNFVQKFGEG